MKNRVRMVHLFPSFRCNLKCSHCYVNTKKDKLDTFAEWDNKTLKEVIDLMNCHNPQIIHIEGGEPLLYINIYKLISQIKNKESITLVTNGTLINKKSLKKIKENGLKNIIISLEGSTNKVNSLLRGKKYYKDVLYGIKMIGKSDLFSTISFTVHKKNIDDIQNMIDFCIKNKIDQLRIGNLLCIGRGKEIESLALDNNNVVKLTKKFIVYIDKYNKSDINIKLSLPAYYYTLIKERCKINSKYINIYPCDAASGQYAIGPNGEIYPCYNVVTCKKNINIKDLKKNTLSFDKKIISKQCPVKLSGHLYIGKLK